METIISRSIFSPATGYIRRGGFDWTCNPYVGCTFGCTYCYAMFLPQNRRPKEQWGRWFQAKENAVELARRDARKVAGESIYMSSVTDPYQPVERSLKLTAGIIEALIPHQPRLLVQTRGPLVLRDLDLLRQFHALRVNLSIPTDSEEIRRSFEPKAPTLEARWKAIEKLQISGIRVGICVTPMLPIEKPEAFGKRIADAGVEVVVTEYFHQPASGFGGATGPVAWDRLQRTPWSRAEYDRCLSLFRKHAPVHEGEAGFTPPPP
jgi:DNA repair photolyase